MVPRGSPGQVISKCLQKTSFWERVEILSLFINMRLQNPSLTEGAKLEIAQFASQLLSVGEEKNMITDPDTKITTVSWIHDYMEGTPVDLISKIYPFISTVPLIAQYLASRAILAIANVDVTRLNNLTLEMMRGKWQMSKSVDEAADPADRETFPPEFFHQIYEPSLPPHILRLKVGMPVMLQRNLDPPRLCNGTRIQLRFIGRKVLEGVIMGGEYEGQKALLPRIPLQSKDNDERSPVLFTRRQFPI